MKTVLKEGDILLETWLDAHHKQFLGKVEIEPHEDFHYLRDTESLVTTKGIAGVMIDTVNRFLESEKKIGLLTEVISPDSQYANGMYERRGWKRVHPHMAVLVYVPNGLKTPSASEAFAMRRTVRYFARRWPNASD